MHGIALSKAEESRQLDALFVMTLLAPQLLKRLDRRLLRFVDGLFELGLDFLQRLNFLFVSVPHFYAIFAIAYVAA
jgi:hypothetical protein